MKDLKEILIESKTTDYEAGEYIKKWLHERQNNRDYFLFFREIFSKAMSGLSDNAMVYEKDNEEYSEAASKWYKYVKDLYDNLKVD